MWFGLPGDKLPINLGQRLQSRPDQAEKQNFSDQTKIFIGCRMAEIWPIIKKIGRQSKWASEVCIHIVSEYSVGIHPNHPFSCLGIHPIHPVLSQKLASRPCVACSQFFYLACLFFQTSQSSITLKRKLDSDICGGRVSFCFLDCVIAFSFWNKKPSIWRWAKENSQPTDDNCWRSQAILGAWEIWALTPFTHTPALP